LKKVIGQEVKAMCRTKLWVIVFTFVLVFLVASCSHNNPIIGKWQANDQNESYTFEFLNSGDLIITKGSYIFGGTWRTIDNDHIEIIVNTPVAFLSLDQPGTKTTLETSFSQGNMALTVTGLGQSVTLHKITSTDTQPMTTPDLTSKPTSQAISQPTATPITTFVINNIRVKILPAKFYTDQLPDNSTYTLFRVPVTVINESATSQTYTLRITYGEIVFGDIYNGGSSVNNPRTLNSGQFETQVSTFTYAAGYKMRFFINGIFAGAITPTATPNPISLSAVHDDSRIVKTAVDSYALQSGKWPTADGSLPPNGQYSLIDFNASFNKNGKTMSFYPDFISQLPRHWDQGVWRIESDARVYVEMAPWDY
jgi:hypothetical protein